MATTIASEWRKARKRHRCIWCGEPIAVGERYIHWRGIFEGDIQANDWHKECDFVVDSDALRDGFDAHAHKRGSQELRNDCRSCAMTDDYAAVLAALPKKRRGDTDALPAFYESRLAECERLLAGVLEYDIGVNARVVRMDEARAYLRFREAETKEECRRDAERSDES